MDMTLVEKYAAGAGQVAAAIQGLAREDFLKVPVEGTWSIGQIVVHLMDSDLIGADRMKRVIAEENPVIIGYDETAFSAKLFFEKMDFVKAADVFKKNRELTAIILRSVPESAFERVGTHNEKGRVTLGELVETYVGHLAHHIKFLRHKRQLIGKP